MPITANKNTGCFSNPKRTDAWRHFRLGLLDLKHGHAHERYGHETEKDGESTTPAHYCFKADKCDDDGHKGGDRAAESLDALRETQIAAVSALVTHVAHDRIAGNLKNVVPMPNTKMQASKTA